jgi:U3 small nucleolar RNA-associated protein 24
LNLRINHQHQIINHNGCRQEDSQVRTGKSSPENTTIQPASQQHTNTSTSQQVKRAISQRDNRVKQPLNAKKEEKKPQGEELTRHIPVAPSNMFFAANTALGPPYTVLVDTNFVSHTIRAKLDMLPAMMDL